MESKSIYRADGHDDTTRNYFRIHRFNKGCRSLLDSRNINYTEYPINGEIYLECSTIELVNKIFRQNDIDFLNILHDQDLSPNGWDFTMTLFLLVFRYSNLNTVDFIISAGIFSTYSITPLKMAVEREDDNVEIVDRILNKVYFSDTSIIKEVLRCIKNILMCCVMYLIILFGDTIW
jgi:hypothetical protein